MTSDSYYAYEVERTARFVSAHDSNQPFYAQDFQSWVDPLVSGMRVASRESDWDAEDWDLAPTRPTVRYTGEEEDPDQLDRLLGMLATVPREYVDQQRCLAFNRKIEDTRVDVVDFKVGHTPTLPVLYVDREPGTAHRKDDPDCDCTSCEGRERIRTLSNQRNQHLKKLRMAAHQETIRQRRERRQRSSNARTA